MLLCLFAYLASSSRLFAKKQKSAHRWPNGAGRRTQNAADLVPLSGSFNASGSSASVPFSGAVAPSRGLFFCG